MSVRIPTRRGRFPAPGSSPGRGSPQQLRTAVVVLNYRTPELTVACLESLRGELDPARDALVVVDNASGDGSAASLQAWLNAHPDLGGRLLVAPSNGGYAAGNNLGIRAVRAETILLLNSDARLLPGALETLRAALEGDPAVGAVSPALLDGEGRPQPSCFRAPSPWSELLDAARTRALDRLLWRHVVARAPDAGSQEADWVCFAAVLLRSAMLEQVGLLDEGFFLYFEDVDLCRRARSAGWRLRCEPRARAVHLGGGSSPVRDLEASGRRLPAYYYASRRRYFLRAHGRRGLLLANLLWTAGRGLSWLRELLGSKQAHTVQAALRDRWLR